MHFERHSHRNAIQILENDPDYRVFWTEISEAINSITEEDLITLFKANYEGKQKSISKAINQLLKVELTKRGWIAEPRIFGEVGYSDKKRDKKWRLDFAKSIGSHTERELEVNLEPTPGIAIEVAFNNDGSTAWNLIKPVLAGELNHVKKETQVGLGIIVCVTEELKRDGGFDNTVGSIDDFKMHLRAMRNILTIPMVIIGLKTFDTFKIDVIPDSNKTKRGYVRML